MNEIICRKCGKIAVKDTKFCTSCGEPIVVNKETNLNGEKANITNSSATKRCEKCGGEIPEDSLFCYICGSRLNNDYSNTIETIKESDDNCFIKKDVVVTTGDLSRNYEVIGPISTYVGEFQLSKLKNKYIKEITNNKEALLADGAEWDVLYGEWSMEKNECEAAFFIATEELKRRAVMVKADAVICMRFINSTRRDFGTTNYYHMYGTAIKYI